MKKILILSISIFLISCKSNYNVDRNIPMPEEFRKLTGYDSIQVISLGKDTLYANFCYPNEWEFFKFKKDTVYIHDTVYTSKHYKYVENLYIGE